MGAAVYWWHTFSFDVFHVNPPLTRIISGLPAVGCRPNYDWSCYSSRPEDRSEWTIGKAFIAANSPETIRWCFILARWSLIPLLLLGGYFGHRLSREMYGESAALVFLALWCFSPMLLTWGGTVCPDAVAAALGIVAIYTFHQWLHKPNWIRTAVAGVCLGLLPLTKLTWIIAFGLWPLIWCLWAVPIYLTKADKRSLPLPPFRQLGTILFLGLYTLNMGYLFDGTFRPLGKYVFISQSLIGQRSPNNQRMPTVENRFARTWLGTIPIPLPAEFVQGLDTQHHDFERGEPSYLRGEWSDHGWWYYYLYALVVKMPLGTWCLFVLAIFCTLFRQNCGAAWRDESVILLSCLTLFLLVSSQTGFSAHSRYILPMLPLLFVAISRVGRAFTLKTPVVAMLTTLSLAYMILSSMSVYPHSLSYFNELAAVLPASTDALYPKSIMEGEESQSILSTIECALTAGPRNGPRHLLGSNIDWGQDLLYLKDWLDKYPDVKLDGLAYCGFYSATAAGIPETPLPLTDPECKEPISHQSENQLGPRPGWYALSVNSLYDRSRQYRYFLRFEPAAMAGYSIYIYHVTLEEANRVRKELGLPKLPKDWRLREETDHAGQRHGQGGGARCVQNLQVHHVPSDCPLQLAFSLQSR